MEAVKSFKYLIRGKIDNYNLVEKIIQIIYSEKIIYDNVFFDFLKFEYIRKKRSSSLKKIMEISELQSYIHIGDYNNKGSRQVCITNKEIHGENDQLGKLFCILKHIDNSYFYNIIFKGIIRDINEMNSSHLDLNYIEISNDYNGKYIEFAFENLQMVKDFQNYLLNMDETIMLKFYEERNIIKLSLDDKIKYEIFHQRIENVISKYKQDISEPIIFNKVKDNNRIYFGKILKREIKQYKYEYAGYNGGAYEIYKYDKFRNCMKILYSYENNNTIKQLSGTIRYQFLNDIYPQIIRLPIINEYINKENIKLFLEYSMITADNLMAFCEHEMRDYLEEVPCSIDLKNLINYI